MYVHGVPHVQYTYSTSSKKRGADLQSSFCLSNPGYKTLRNQSVSVGLTQLFFFRSFGFKSGVPLIPEAPVAQQVRRAHMRGFFLLLARGVTSIFNRSGLNSANTVTESILF